MADLPLSPGDLQRYWSAKGVKQECELCGNHEWSLLPSPLQLRAPDTLASFIMSKALTVVVAGCGNCGNLRMFPLGTLEDWLGENKQ